MEKFEKLKQLISNTEKDVEKFYNANNAAAGTRVRKAMQGLKVIAAEIRKEVTERRRK